MDDKAVLTLPVKWHGPTRPKRTTGPLMDEPETPKGPRKIIELEGTEPDAMRLEPDALHLWEGHLWSWDEVGCTECIDESDSAQVENRSITLFRRDDDGNEYFHCLKHGQLDSVACTAHKEFTITIGGETTEGEVEHKDAFLVPSSHTEEERAAYIKRLLGEMAMYEDKTGAFPSDSDLTDDE